MNRRWRLTEEAAAELVEAIAWYEERSRGSGLRLLRAMEGALARLAAFPDLAPLVGKRTRRHVLSPYPHALFYMATPDEILVVGVEHFSKKPKTWP